MSLGFVLPASALPRAYVTADPTEATVSGVHGVTATTASPVRVTTTAGQVTSVTATARQTTTVEV